MTRESIYKLVTFVKFLNVDTSHESRMTFVGIFIMF